MQAVGVKLNEVKVKLVEVKVKLVEVKRSKHPLEATSLE